MSPDGRFVAFISYASDITLGDSDIYEDVYLRDVASSISELVSVNSSGEKGNLDSGLPSISDDGRLVAFWSRASNLDPSDTGFDWDVFLRDRQAGTTVLVSRNDAGEQGNSRSIHPAISGNGRYVAFESEATNLVPGDTNGSWDIFVRDTVAGHTSRVSVGPLGAQANGYSRDASISDDGQYVAFESTASNLVPGDTNGEQDIFVHDRATGTTVRASVSATGAQANSSSLFPTISGNGQLVVFLANANNLVAGDIFFPDLVAKDLLTGATELVSVTSDGLPGTGYPLNAAVTFDARYIAFDYHAGMLAPAPDGATGAVYVRDRALGTTTLTSIGYADGVHIGYRPAISDDGRYVAFDSFESQVVANDDNDSYDVFLRDRGTPTCERGHREEGQVTSVAHDSVEPSAGPAAEAAHDASCALAPHGF